MEHAPPSVPRPPFVRERHKETEIKSNFTIHDEDGDDNEDGREEKR